MEQLYQFEYKEISKEAKILLEILKKFELKESNGVYTHRIYDEVLRMPEFLNTALLWF